MMIAIMIDKLVHDLIPFGESEKNPQKLFDPVSPDRIFIASNYCCRGQLLPQLSLSRVPLARGASTWSPPNLRFPPWWELRERVGGTHLQKEEKGRTEVRGANRSPNRFPFLSEDFIC